MIPTNFLRKFRNNFYNPWQESLQPEAGGKIPLSIAVINQKSGVEKTTVAINLAAVMAQQNKKVQRSSGFGQALVSIGVIIFDIFYQVF